MKLQREMLDLIQETITRLDSIYLHELGTDTNTWLDLPRIALIDPNSNAVGHYRWDPEHEGWYFETLSEAER